MTVCEENALWQIFDHIKTAVMRGKKLLLMLSLITLSILAKANNEKEGKKSTEPCLNGSVADAVTKKPVQGVTISISGVHGEKREVTTDARGYFKVPQLPAGEIIIVLEKKGYKTCRREGILVKEGVSQKLNFDLSGLDDGNAEVNDVFHPLMRMIDGR